MLREQHRQSPRGQKSGALHQSERKSGHRRTLEEQPRRGMGLGPGEGLPLWLGPGTQGVFHPEENHV